MPITVTQQHSLPGHADNETRTNNPLNEKQDKYQLIKFYVLSEEEKKHLSEKAIQIINGEINRY